MNGPIPLFARGCLRPKTSLRTRYRLLVVTVCSMRPTQLAAVLPVLGEALASAGTSTPMAKGYIVEYSQVSVQPLGTCHTGHADNATSTQ